MDRARTATSAGAGGRPIDRSSGAGGPLVGTRFLVRHVGETGSTNEDVLALARDGAPEGTVLVAEHQTAGRGRRGRVWVSPAGGALLASVLLRPPAPVAGAVTMAVAVALAEAIEAVTRISPGLKWPNDLVLGEGSDERKLAGILAEADWPAGSTISSGWREPTQRDRVVVVVGAGVNLTWRGEAPPDVAEVAVALDQATDVPIDRSELLEAYLRRLESAYGELVAGGLDARDRLVRSWRTRSATLGRRVRVDLGADDIEGTAVDVTPEGHLIVESLDGGCRTVAVGDVVHLRPM